MGPLQILAKSMERKKQIRKEVIAKRLQMSEEEVMQKSRIITKMVFELQEYVDANTIFCYVAFRNEVDTKELIEDAWKRGKCVAVPRVEGKVMNFYQIDSWDDVRLGTMKIEEPISSCKKVDSRTGFMLMPGVAFDVKRHRVGYGGGYYDKFLATGHDICTVAIAFENQMFENLPTEEHDLKPYMIITENRILK